MKRLASFILFCGIVVLRLSAQGISASDSAVLNHIISVNRQYRSMEVPFRHVRIHDGVTDNCFGTFYYEAVKPKKKKDVTAKMSMLYSDPEGEYYIITTTHLHNCIAGHCWHFNYRYVPLMKQLGNAMAWSVNGDIYSLYNNFNVDFKLTTDEKYYVISLDSRRGFNKGVSRLVLKYDKSTCLIHYLFMEEKMGMTHIYTMGLDAHGKYHAPQLNHSIDPKVYELK